MSRRTLLSPEQRARLFSIPIDTAEMTRYFVLSAEDLTLIRTKRRAVNRLGFAIQLCALRHPGRVLDPAELPPKPMLAFVGKQVGIDPALFGDYARRAETRREHMIELQKLLRLRTFGFADWRSCLKAGADAAWATDRGEPIVQAMIAHLRANNVLLPTVNMLERIGLAARARARKKVFEVLADGLTAVERAALEKLLVIDPELRRSRFAWLRDYSESPAPTNIVALLDRLEYARALGLGRGHTGRIHPDRLNRLVGEGAIMTVQHIADLEPARRTASCQPPEPATRCRALCARSGGSNGRCSPCNGSPSQICASAATLASTKARPATRSGVRCFSIARAKFETGPSRTRAFVRPASASSPQRSSIGTRSTCTVPSSTRVPSARPSRMISLSMSRPWVGNISR